MYHIHSYPSRNKLDEALANAIVDQLKEGIKLRGQASLAVSGGKTPLNLFNVLSQKQLDWSKITVTLVDERWVDDKQEASNAHLVKTHLIQNNAKNARFVGLKNNAKTPFDGEHDTEQVLRDQVSLPVDVLILGMGDDGHTASLFPHANNLKKGLDMHSGRLSIGMTPTDAPHDRITMTLPLIMSSRHIYLHIIGDQKKTVLDQALKSKDADIMPIRAILHQSSKPIEIYWAK